jgi:hypothetical protein
LEARDCPSLTIQLDFDSYPSHFFDSPARRDLVRLAAQTLGSLIEDHLSAITPGGGNTWAAKFTDPSTSNPVTRNNLSVPADTVVVYVGARAIDGTGGTLGEGGSGGENSFGSAAWLNTVQHRGKSSSQDFPWGGMMYFDTSENWYFGTTASGLGANQVDFLSVAEHELGHVLGLSHQPEGARDSEGFEAAMDPTLDLGTRKLFTKLDIDALAARGWTIITDNYNNTLANAGTLPNTTTAVWTVTAGTNASGAAYKTYTSVDYSIEDPIDVDMFAVPVQAGQTVTVSTASAGGPSVDTYLRLFDASGTEIDRADNGVSDTLTHAFPGGGTYYVGVSSAPNTAYSALSAFARSLAGGTGTYKLTITVTDRAQPTTPPQPSPSNLGSAAASLTHSHEAYQNFVVNAYQQYLGRAPDAAGLAGWVGLMQQGTVSDEQLEASFIGSPEYIRNHGGTGAAWVRGMYTDLLGRAAGDAEVGAWVNLMNGGLDPSGVAYGFAASAEREGQRVRDDYSTYLGRAASQAEVDAWVRLFKGGLRNEDVIAGFVGSVEYFNNPGKGNGNRTTWVEAAYHDVLHRSATTGEVGAWIGFLS